MKEIRLLWAPPQKLDDGKDVDIQWALLTKLLSFNFIFILSLCIHTYPQLERGKYMKREKSLWRIVWHFEAICVVKPCPFAATAPDWGPPSPSQFRAHPDWCWHATMPWLSMPNESTAALSTLCCWDSSTDQILLIPASAGMEICQHSTWHKWNQSRGHQNAGNYFSHLLWRYLHAFRLCSRVCLYLENPKFDCCNYLAIWDQIKQSPVIQSLLHDFFLKKAVV